MCSLHISFSITSILPQHLINFTPPFCFILKLTNLDVLNFQSVLFRHKRVQQIDFCCIFFIIFVSALLNPPYRIWGFMYSIPLENDMLCLIFCFFKRNFAVYNVRIAFYDVNVSWVEFCSIMVLIAKLKTSDRL